MTVHELPVESTDDEIRGAERMVVGAALLSNGASIDDCSNLTPDDFGWPVYAELWRLLTQMRSDNAAVDPLTVKHQINGLDPVHPLRRLEAHDLLGIMQSVVSPASAAYYAGIVREGADLRAVHAAGVRLMQAASGMDAADAKAYAHTILDSLDSRDTTDEAVRIGDVLGEVMQELEDGVEPGLPTPWPDLNHSIGGLRPGGLYVVGGRPGTGKSVLLLDLAWHASRRGRVLMFSLEMDRREITRRLIAAVGGADYAHLVNNRMADSDWDRVARAAGPIAESELLVADREAVRAEDIRVRARRTAKHGLSLVVLDYLQLLTGESRVKDQNRTREVDQQARALKMLARELRVPVVVASQVNRAAESRRDGRPTLADLRESGGIENHADVVLLLHRDNSDEEKARTLEVLVAKNRQGPTGMVPLGWEGHHMRAVSTWR